MSAGEGAARSLRPASGPRPRPELDQLLVVDDLGRTLPPTTFGALASHLSPGDLLVVNDAATLPASLAGLTAQGEPVELRLMAHVSEGVFLAARFGAGDHRTRTEHRAVGPLLAPGATLSLGDGALRAEVRSVDPRSPRLLCVALSPLRPGLPLLHAIARAGRPIQYAHVPEPLALWDVQTIFAARPWAFEIPSAGRPFTHALVQRLLERGVALASITHAAGVTSTGDEAIDALLPLPERSSIPDATAEAIRQTRARGGRVIAAGTTVTRCLEDAAARDGLPRAGEFVATWRGSAGAPLRAVDALVTGMHAPGESHFELLRAFASEEALERAAVVAREHGFLAHEMGDSMLLFRSRRARG